MRIRLDQPRGDQKYHQRSGTAPHAFLPPSIWGKNKNLDSPIIVGEGEKKTLALAEEGFTAVGIGGFYNFRNNGALVPELSEIFQYVRDPVFIFLGDRDVVYNYQFSHAALTFAKLVASTPVRVSCVPLDAPGKGVDDCRHVLGEQFKEWVEENLLSGVSIGPESTAGSIALALLRIQVPALSKLEENEREEAARGLSKLAAGLQGFPLEQNSVIEMAIEKLGLSRRVFNCLVKVARQKVVVDILASDVGGDPTKVVNLGEQPGSWTRRVLEVIGATTYFYGDALCDLKEGKFVAHTPASLVSFLDSPDRCRFMRSSRQGETSPTHLSEKETRIILGALRNNGDVVRQVDTMAHVPALVWSPDGPQLITGYSREHRILAAGGAMELPEPAAAAVELLELIRDFDFATPGDAGRAIAFLLSPALASGGFLNSGRTPFFMIKKDQKGAGAGTFVRMLAAIYAAPPCSITPEDPKAAKEDLSKHLLEGANLIYFDNIRGKVLSTLPFLESLLTEPKFTCRAPYLHGTVDVTRRVIACTSNGAVLSSDLADRTVNITIRKRPDGYGYHPWLEGDLIDHVAATRPRYLACIYELIHAWAHQHRPPGSHLSGFRFPQWERACAWILENYFSPLPFLDSDHKTSQIRLSDPDFDLLRAVLRAVIEQGRTGSVTTTDLVRIAVKLGRMKDDGKSALMEMGRILTKEFPREGESDFAKEFRVARRDVGSSETHYEKIKTYSIMPFTGEKEPVVKASPANYLPDLSAVRPPPPTPFAI